MTPRRALQHRTTGALRWPRLRRRRVAAVVAGVVAVTSQVLATGRATAAEPSASPIAGDPRSPGEGPGLVGDPLFAIAAVVAIGILAVIVTTVWVRATDRRSERGDG